MKSIISKRLFLKMIALFGFSFVGKVSFGGDKISAIKTAIAKAHNFDRDNRFASICDMFNGMEKGHFAIDVSGAKIDSSSLLNEMAYSIWQNNIPTILFSSANSVEDIEIKLLFSKTEMGNKNGQREISIENWHALCERAKILSETPLSIITAPYLTYKDVTRKLKHTVREEHADLVIIDNLWPSSLLKLKDGETTEFKIGETFEKMALELDITIVTLI